MRAGERRGSRNPLAGIVAVIAAACLAISLVGAGFFACAVPDLTTQLLAQATSNDRISPFSKDELVRAAVATKDYTVGAHDIESLERAIGDINRTANTPYAHASDVFDAPEEYTLTPDAVSHLDDVYNVVAPAERVIGGIAVVAAVALAACGLMRGRRLVGAVLVGGGIAVIACFAALGAWAAVDFRSLFAAMHSLFFTAGTWTFSYDSLLICMYPTAFWMGMGVVWLAVTAVASILSIAIGANLRHAR